MARDAESVVLAAARRTPIGAFQGALAGATAVGLGGTAIAAAVADAGVQGADISQALMGCVLPAGLGQAPARQAVLAAGLPVSLPSTTINKVCGSGLYAIMLGCDLIRAGSASMVIAGGLESMTNAPYLLPGARAGYRMGHQQAIDHMFFDGLRDAYGGQMMGHFAEKTAAKYGFEREEQDEFATESVRRANAAVSTGAFVAEIAPVTIRTRNGEVTVSADETPGTIDIDKIPRLKPAFAPDGTVTAASSSSISDGASATVLLSEREAKRRSIRPLARIVGHAVAAHEPAWFTTAPVAAITRLYDALGWKPADVDLYEINEAFAVVAMAAIRELRLDPARVNVNGGACALGHPLGATGARICVTLIHALRARGLRRGIASLCLGGGEAVAIGIEIE